MQMSNHQNKSLFVYEMDIASKYSFIINEQHVGCTIGCHGNQLLNSYLCIKANRTIYIYVFTGKEIFNIVSHIYVAT